MSLWFRNSKKDVRQLHSHVDHNTESMFFSFRPLDLLNLKVRQYISLKHRALYFSCYDDGLAV